MKVKSIISLFIFTGVSMVISATEAVAQCAMCQQTAQSGLQNSHRVGLGLNDGIIYLLLMPYIAAAVIGYSWYKHYRKKKLSEQP